MVGEAVGDALGVADGLLVGAGVALPVFQLNPRRLKKSIERALEIHPNAKIQKILSQEDFDLRLLKVVQHIQELKQQST